MNKDLECAKHAGKTKNIYKTWRNFVKKSALLCLQLKYINIVWFDSSYVVDNDLSELNVSSGDGRPGMCTIAKQLLNGVNQVLIKSNFRVQVNRTKLRSSNPWSRDAAAARAQKQQMVLKKHGQFTYKSTDRERERIKQRPTTLRSEQETPSVTAMTLKLTIIRLVQMGLALGLVLDWRISVG